MNTERWDECVSASGNVLIYGLSWYLDQVCNHSWDALVLNDYEAVMPLPVKKKYFIHYVYPPFFAQQLGIFSKKEMSAKMVQQFFNAIPFAFLYIDVVLNEDSSSRISSTLNPSFHTNIVLDLHYSKETLQQRYGYNLRRNLKKVAKEEIALVHNISLTPIEKLFREARGKEFPNIKEQHYRTLQTLVAEAVSRQHCFMLGVENKQQQLIAGAVFMIFHNRITFLFSGQSSEGKNKKALFFLLDQVIQRYAHTNMILDFEGGNDKDLARFYKGFGGIETCYARIIINKLSWLYKKK